MKEGLVIAEHTNVSTSELQKSAVVQTVIREKAYAMVMGRIIGRKLTDNIARKVDCEWPRNVGRGKNRIYKQKMDLKW